MNNISELMVASDVIITKPGGITTAEALCRKLPMIIVKPIPGQEANNTTYLTSRGAAIKVDEPRSINEIIDDLFLHPDKLSVFREASGRISKPRASMDIAALLLKSGNAR